MMPPAMHRSTDITRTDPPIREPARERTVRPSAQSRHRGGFRWLAIELFALVAIAFVLGLLGPFGTYSMPVALRLAYWIGVGAIGYAIFRPLNIAADWLAAETRVPHGLAIAVSCLIAGLPMTWLIAFVIAGMQVSQRLSGADYALLYAQTTGIGLGIYGLMRLMFAVPHDAGNGETLDQAHRRD